MKNPFKKKSLSQKRITREAKKYMEIGKAPIIACAITLTDGASLTTTSAAVKLLGDSLGEDVAAKWHGKYMDKFDKLLKQAYSELEELVKEAKEKKAE